MLQPDERSQLREIVSSLYDFTDAGARGRRILIEQASLGRFLPGLDLSGSAQVVAGDLIGRLEKFGPLPSEPGRPISDALGALLSYVMTLGDVPEGDKRFLAGLIVKYGLVGDQAYMDRLRERFQIATSAFQQPTGPSAPPASTDAAAGPSFQVTLEDQQGLEAIIGSEDNFLDIYVLAGALYSAQAVCRVEVPVGTARGTGFLVGPDLVLTNQHVMKTKDYVGEAVVRFDYTIDATDVALPGRVFKLQPDFYYSSPAEELDYALIRLEDRPLKEKALEDDLNGLAPRGLLLAGKHRGYLVLHGEYIKEYDRVNIIQHPDGDPMKVVMTQNRVALDMANTRVQYIADTMDGSSGSPVFNRKWEVVALHHSGRPYPPDDVGSSLKKAWKGRYRVNEGIPIRAILADFAKKGIDKLLPPS